MAEPRDAVIAIDVGGTDTKAAVSTADGAEVVRKSLPTPVSDGVGAVLDSLVELIEQLRSQAEPAHQIRGVGLIFPGIVDSAAGIARYSTNIGWRELPIRDLISRRTGLPVAIDHDVRAAGLAEAQLGAARGVAEALYLAIGTGISGAVISAGKVLSGAANMAGEIGHLPAVPDGELCACGQRGCTETYASAAALPRRYLAAGGLASGGSVADGLASGGSAADGPPGSAGPPLRAQDVLARAASGDPIAVAVFADAVRALGRALVTYTLLLDPGLIVVGGGLAGAGAALLDPLAAELRRGLAWRQPPALVPASFGADSGRRGAALVGWQAQRRGD